jgi:hypothetical protein
MMDNSHGSPYDRGRADAWYGRSPLPHKGSTSQRDTDLTPLEIAAYNRGFDDHYDAGGKDWT